MEQELHFPERGQDCRFGKKATAFILAKTVEAAQEGLVDRETFHGAFNFAVYQLNLDEDTLCRMMKTSRPTVQRWILGHSSPHRVGRASVFQEFLSETNRQIEQESHQ
jgi:hypothetical protein